MLIVRHLSPKYNLWVGFYVKPLIIVQYTVDTSPVSVAPEALSEVIIIFGKDIFACKVPTAVEAFLFTRVTNMLSLLSFELLDIVTVPEAIVALPHAAPGADTPSICVRHNLAFSIFTFPPNTLEGPIFKFSIP